MIWKILEIDKTKDEDVIRSAYREKLRYVNPEDDEEGFKELRRAYEEALEYASQPEDEGLNDADESEYGYGKKDEVDEWLKRIDMIYQDVVKRRDESMWEPVLHDPVCDDLDMELEAAEKLLVYFMSHSYMPQSIWQLVDKRFHYMDNYDQLKEKFPENYLDYVMWQMKRPNFIDFHLFDGVTDSHVDDYIGTLYEEKNAFEEGNMEAVERFLKELKRYDVTHPYTETEEARYLLYRAQTQKKKAENSTDAEEHLSEKRDEPVPDWKEDEKQALSIMEELDFEYSDNPYIERIYAEALLANGEVSKAKSVYEGLTEADPENYSASLGIARCVYLEGNPEDAKELVEDILEERVQDVECMQLLDEINEELVKTYESALSEKEDMIPEEDSKEEKDGETVRELSFKLGWCYYQQKEFEKGIQLLDGLDEGEDYDYINLRCRLYLANENYEVAYPLTKKWLQLIEEAVDDGSKEVQKKKNRLSLAHFSIGICLWELKFKEKEELLLKESKKEQVSGIDDKISDLERELEHAAEYIKKAIEEEQNTLVKLSYMEQLARFYLAQKQYEKCIDICDDIITKDRGFYPAYVHRQRANYELKNAKEVIDDYFACKEIYPGYSVPYVLAAEVFMAFEQYDDVESVIKEGEEAGFQSDGLEFYKIKCLHYKNFSVENVRKAIDQLDLLMERIRIRPEEEGSDIEDLSDLNREMAILYWDLDLTSKALEIVDKYLDEHPDTSGMLQLKVDILSREKQYEEALAACRLLVKTNPKNLHYRIKLGNCYEWMENTEKAIECYRMILMENSDFVPAVRRLMYVYSYLSNENRDLELCKKGIEYANRLIEITGNAEGYVERGNLYIDLYELEKAVEDCKEAVKLDPEAYYAYNNMGCALLKLRRIDEAIEPLEKAIAMDPDKDHLPYLNLAECYVIKKDYEKAIHAYEEILRIRPKAMRMREEIAKIWIKMGQYLKTVDFYKSLIRESQKRIGIVKDSMVIKILLKQEGQQEECERLLKYYAELADIYRQMGDKDNAEKWYKNIEKVYFKLKEPCSISHAETVAEYYRDKGDIKEAERVLVKLLDYMEKNNISRYHVYFTLTTVMFEKGDRERAKKYADAFIKGLLKQHGGEEAMLSDRRYLSMYAYDMVIMHICAGRLEEAKKYLEKMKNSHVCVTCETCACFEYHFAMGLVAELEGKAEDAKQYYKKAIEIKGDYPCAQRHLKKL
ncbi:MAG: tetratricopeptide repeat protein [Lachnospiraceae bacterium]|nr:tetratricopeptide repeat protein [Lachnospiraceae bacterium]